jgi:AcrR family transcriptional regulator
MIGWMQGVVDRPAERVDGRRARRARGRVAVVDAAFDLLQEGAVMPGVDLIAERAGVSVASVFRYFDGLDDLHVQTFERFLERFEPLFEPARSGPRADRIERFVRARLDLYEQAGTIMAIGRLRALEHEPLVTASAETRARLARQARETFALDLAEVAEPADLLAAIDALASLDGWTAMRRTHERSRRRIERIWVSSIDAVIDRWAGEPAS